MIWRFSIIDELQEDKFNNNTTIHVIVSQVLLNIYLLLFVQDPQQAPSIYTYILALYNTISSLVFILVNKPLFTNSNYYMLVLYFNNLLYFFITFCQSFLLNSVNYETDIVETELRTIV